MNRPLTPREQARQTREMVSDILDYLENLGVGVGVDRATLARGANGATVLRTPEGKLLVQVEEPELADFLRRAPGWLASLCGRVEELERSAYLAGEPPPRHAAERTRSPWPRCARS